jgi:hypothetical protein
MEIGTREEQSKYAYTLLLFEIVVHLNRKASTTEHMGPYAPYIDLTP